MLSLLEAIREPAAFTTENKSYLPLPNRVDVVITDQLAPKEFTSTAFIIAFHKAGTIGANNKRRGIEIPGGHIEHNESAKEAAIRECFEETGYNVQHVTPIGFLRMISEGDVDDNYKYPHPISFQQFFTGKTVGKISVNFKPNDEVSWPTIVTNTNDIPTHFFYQAAKEAMKNYL